jgi:hypothetical protein
MKRPVKKVKRFDDGGYTGDDPIVKYRMGKSSEADTYEALGQKDLADASRAKEPKVEPKEEPKTTKSIAPSDNFYDTSSEKEIADASFKTSSTETPKAVPKPAAPKPVVKAAAPKVESKSAPKVTSTKSEDKPVAKSDDKENPKAVAEAYRQAAALNTPFESNFPIQKETKKGPSGKAKANRDAGKPSKSPNRSYKSGGTVKRSSASNRGDGCATKGHTRGKIC